MARFPGLLWHDADSDYVISFPDLPGCIAVGETAEDALRLGEDALGFHLEGLGQAGLPIPAPQSIDALLAVGLPGGAVMLMVTARPPKAPAVRVNITLDKNLLAEIDAYAVDAGTTRSGLLAEAARRLIGR